MMKLMMVAMLVMGSASIASAAGSCPYQNSKGLFQNTAYGNKASTGAKDTGTKGNNSNGKH